MVFWDQELWRKLGSSEAPGWWQTLSLACQPILQSFGSHSRAFSLESVSSTFHKKLARKKNLSTVTEKKKTQIYHCFKTLLRVTEMAPG